MVVLTPDDEACLRRPFRRSGDPPHEIELEANRFAVECVFFADRFVELVGGHPRHLRSAMALASEHGASFEATFRHYVECHPAACLLLASDLVDVDLATGEAIFQVRQYIRSASAEQVIRSRQRFRSPELSALVNGLGGGSEVVEYEVVAGNPPAQRRFVAQSFWNTYKLFTLVWL